MKRSIAIDWSGAKTGARSKIWLAEVRDGRLTRLESGRDRREVVAHVISDADADPNVVVGFDFAFSFPRWYAERLDATSIEELSIEEVWNLVRRARLGLAPQLPGPFWGKPGRGKPELPEHFRRTEQHASAKGSIPKSVFQIGGGGCSWHGLDPRNASPGDTPRGGLLDLALSRSPNSSGDRDLSTTAHWLGE